MTFSLALAVAIFLSAASTASSLSCLSRSSFCFRSISASRCLSSCSFAAGHSFFDFCAFLRCSCFCECFHPRCVARRRARRCIAAMTRVTRNTRASFQQFVGFYRSSWKSSSFIRQTKIMMVRYVSSSCLSSVFTHDRRSYLYDAPYLALCFNQTFQCPVPSVV